MLRKRRGRSGRQVEVGKKGRRYAVPKREAERGEPTYEPPAIVWEDVFEPLVYAASVGCAKYPGAGEVCDVQPSTT